MHLKLTMICIAAGSLVACQTTSEIFELKNQRRFISESSDYVCSQLRVKSKRLGWVHGATATSVGVIAQPCEADQTSDWALHGGASELKTNEQLGYVGEWTVFPWNNQRTAQLRLAGLSGFSSPAFCRDFVAYWANADETTQVLIMRIGQLASGISIRESIGHSPMAATDDTNYLAIPYWNESCSIARFIDPIDGQETTLSINE